MLVSCLIMALSLAAISYTKGSDEKRIFPSDPQYIQQELTRFQSELQEMQVKYNELSTLKTNCNTQNTKLAELQVKYDTQITNLTHLQAEYDSQLQAYYTASNTKLAELQVKYNNLHTKLTELQGSAGGSYYSHTGAAAEYVCMPNDPIWGPHKDLVYDEHVGYIYGAEYDEPTALFGMPNEAEDVPCAVCLGTQHTASLMIPGRTQCYPGWTEVYHGDLASGLYGHPVASQYVCVDRNAQAVPGGGTHNENGKLFFGVKAKCGTLPCPPYEDGKFLSCVVCIK